MYVLIKTKNKYYRILMYTKYLQILFSFITIEFNFMYYI